MGLGLKREELSDRKDNSNNFNTEIETIEFIKEQLILKMN
uniref:Uncharacterized protein n=1 Tax=viral metagenome TaxID=1070528 RepID=A0A6C0BDC7_9ZZZZ